MRHIDIVYQFAPETKTVFKCAYVNGDSVDADPEEVLLILDAVNATCTIKCYRRETDRPGVFNGHFDDYDPDELTPFTMRR